MNTKILCVDDEPNVLAGYRRQLRKEFDIETALGGAEGLQALRTRGPFAVVVSDMRMPGMSGVEFLRQVRAVAPDAVRMMLTGNSDQQTAMDAVNEGRIFRFLVKPCPADTLAEVLRAALEQHRLVTIERELLEQTLHGSIKVLAEVLSLTHPVAFGRAVRLQRLVRKLAELLNIEDIWRLEVAAMLSHIGCITVPDQVLTKVFDGLDLEDKELQMYQRHPEIGAALIAQIPRLQAVAEVIAYQEKHFDGQGLPKDDKKAHAIPFGARILKAAFDFDCLESRGKNKPEAAEIMRTRSGWYDPDVLGAIDAISRTETTYTRKSVAVRDLHPGMILDENVVNSNGLTLISKGQEITETLLCRLLNIATRHAIREPIAVLEAMAASEPVGKGI